MSTVRFIEQYYSNEGNVKTARDQEIYDACSRIIKSSEGSFDYAAMGELYVLLKSVDDGKLAVFGDMVFNTVNGVLQLNATDIDSSNKYNIVALDNGNMYVQASRNVLSGNDVSTWRKEITGFFNELLDGQESIDINTVEGDVLTITKPETANKARDNYKQVSGKAVKMSNEEFKLKLNAEAHIDELAEISKPINNSATADTKNHDFAKDGFSYRTAYFEDFDGQYYKITMSVGNNGETATVYNVGRIKKDSLPSAAKITAVVGSKALGKLSTNSIPENGGNVNSSDVVFHEPDKRDMPSRDVEGDRYFEKSNNVNNDKVKRHIFRFAKKLGVEVRFDKNVKTGKYNFKNGVIYLNPNLPTAQMYSIIFKHEFVHSLESRKKYSEFKNYCFKDSELFFEWCKLSLSARNQSIEGSRTEIINRLRDTYTKLYENSNELDKYEKAAITPEGMETEMLAQFVGEAMFRGEQDSSDFTPLDRMVSELKQPKYKRILNTILDWFKSVIHKLTGTKENYQVVRDLRALERKFKAAYNSKVVENKNSTNEQVEEKNFFVGYSNDGKGKYKSNFPLGTPKAAKAERILKYIQNIWSKKPIKLNITDSVGNVIKTIEAKFDPTYDETQNNPTDASKLMGGNRHGNASDQRVTLDLADDYYEIIKNSKYNYSKDETGKQLETHKNVKQWHYFINDIYFAESDSEDYNPYRVTVNVKEKNDGNFVYSFSAEKEKKLSTQQTVHAAVNGETPANAQLSNTNVPQNTSGVNSNNMQKTQKNSETAENVTDIEEKSAISELIDKDLLEYENGNITREEFIKRVQASSDENNSKIISDGINSVLDFYGVAAKQQNNDVEQYKKELSNKEKRINNLIAELDANSDAKRRQIEKELAIWEEHENSELKRRDRERAREMIRREVRQLDSALRTNSNNKHVPEALKSVVYKVVQMSMVFSDKNADLT